MATIKPVNASILPLRINKSLPVITAIISDIVVPARIIGITTEAKVVAKPRSDVPANTIKTPELQINAIIAIHCTGLGATQLATQIIGDVLSMTISDI